MYDSHDYPFIETLAFFLGNFSDCDNGFLKVKILCIGKVECSNEAIDIVSLL